MTFQIQNHPIILQRPDHIEMPIPWVGHIPFAFLLIELLKPEKVVELGVHTGNSFNAFCQAVKQLDLKAKCYGVDTWKGEEHAGFYEENIFKNLQKYQENNYQGIGTLLRMTFDEALKGFENNTIDLLHIDGLHTYEAVKHDFETWLPKVKSGGVIIFHDTQVKKSDFGVWKLWEEIASKFTSYEFKHSHGLGVLVVGQNQAMESLLRGIKQSEFLEKLFPKLGDFITDTTGDVGDYLKTLEKENARLHKEITSLHAKAESMRLKNRLKRLFFMYKPSNS